MILMFYFHYLAQNMFSIANCIVQFHLTLPLLTNFCEHINTAENFTVTDVRVAFLVNACCPSILNETTASTPTKLTKLEKYDYMCEYLRLTEDHPSECNNDDGINARNSRLDFVFDWFQFTYFSIIIPIGCIGNSLVILTINRTVRNHNYVPMLFIKNLAIADVMSLIGFVLIYIPYKHWIEMPIELRRYLFPSFDIFVGSASLMFVMAISMDRTMAVVFPFKHFSGTINSKGRISSFLIWFFAFLLFALSLVRIGFHDVAYSTHLYYVTIFIAFFLPCSLVLISYTVIIVVTIRSNQKLVRENARRNSISNHGLSRFREIKLAINVTVIIFPIMFGWGFVASVSIYEELTKAKLSEVVDNLILIVPITMSSINPLVYLMMTSSLRKNSIKTLHSLFLCKKCMDFDGLRFGSFSRNSTKDSGLMTEEEGPSQQNENTL